MSNKQIFMYFHAKGIVIYLLFNILMNMFMFLVCFANKQEKTISGDAVEVTDTCLYESRKAVFWVGILYSHTVIVGFAASSLQSVGQ